MVERVISTKKAPAPPSLETRIADMLGNENSGSGELSEIITETEQAITKAEQEIAAKRDQVCDLVQCPDPTEINLEIAAAELASKRLDNVLPKLRAKLAAALRIERGGRWHAEHDKVESRRIALNDQTIDFIRRKIALLKEQRALDATIDEFNREVDAVNNGASELNAEQSANRRNGIATDNFYYPYLKSMDHISDGSRVSAPRTWNTSLAAAYAETGMPIPSNVGAIGPDWCNPDYQNARREAVEKEQADLARYHEQAAKDQEERMNREERERFLQQHPNQQIPSAG